MDASIVIATRNRAEDLRIALRSCVMQSNATYEILVFDDASEDHTERVVSEFPTVRYFKFDQRKGYICLRNLGFSYAKGEYIFSLDDDARFTSSDTISLTLAKFKEYSDTAAIAMDYIEPKTQSLVSLCDAAFVRSFIGCSHSIHRETALVIGGYREYFIHQGEERDLCLRIWTSGKAVRFFRTPQIVHAPSDIRDLSVWHGRGLRNTFLFDFLNTPLIYLPWRFAKSFLQLGFFAIKKHGFRKTIVWFSLGICDCIAHYNDRSPVRIRVYRYVSSLPFAGPSSNCVNQ